MTLAGPNRTVALALVAAIILGGLFWAFLPAPVAVDLVEVQHAPMQVTISAEGITRVRDSWRVTAPVTGAAHRSPVRLGDAVVGGSTVVAVVEPAEPPFLDARARRLAEASVSEAEAAVRLAEANRARAQTQLDHALAERDRIRALTERGTLSRTVLEDAEQAALVASSAHDVAQADLDMRRATLARMQAQLESPATIRSQASATCCVEITAPHSGLVLELTDESARLVTAGETLLVIGDPSDLEIRVDLLSGDAVGLNRGTPARITGWGGETVLEAEVRQIGPSGFSRISALGIEEQRVPLILDILSPPNQRAGLGAGYRVEVTLVTWEAENVLQVPSAALFRSADDWALFTEVNGRAVQTPVVLGHVSRDWAEVLAGVAEGARVIAYPGSSVAHGTKITPREAMTP
ncbi:membrane protein [Roseicyclus marinus]|uniref:Membrane protein n=2 Tax=Roseicyclus marinus TaxID=2161673 RepID=A0AA48HLM3_9RHOB|nr:membrane protein [Roseicyclus marinus]